MTSDSQPSEASEKPEKTTNSADSASIEYWRGLAEIAREEELEELEVEQNGIRISLRSRSSAPVGEAPQVMFAPQYPQAFAPSPVAAATPPVAAASMPPEKNADENLVEIVSPMVGMFYRAPSPNDPNFVEVGDHIDVGKTVALVEAMKVFNEITSEVAGTVVAVKPNSGDLVETGQVLITLRK